VKVLRRRTAVPVTMVPLNPVEEIVEATGLAMVTPVAVEDVAPDWTLMNVGLVLKVPEGKEMVKVPVVVEVVEPYQHLETPVTEITPGAVMPPVKVLAPETICAVSVVTMLDGVVEGGTVHVPSARRKLTVPPPLAGTFPDPVDVNVGTRVEIAVQVGDTITSVPVITEPEVHCCPYPTAADSIKTTANRRNSIYKYPKPSEVTTLPLK
jgi:hypothetical protein